MRPVAQADRGGRAGDLLHRDHVLGVAEPGAAVLLLDRDAVQAERAQARPQIARELVAPVDRLGARRDLGLREAGDRVPDHVGGLAEIEVERWEAELRHGRSSLEQKQGRQAEKREEAEHVGDRGDEHAGGDRRVEAEPVEQRAAR